jgi:hypothetical protein
VPAVRLIRRRFGQQQRQDGKVVMSSVFRVTEVQQRGKQFVCACLKSRRAE